jgi:hypothetical protein
LASSLQWLDFWLVELPVVLPVTLGALLGIVLVVSVPLELVVSILCRTLPTDNMQGRVRQVAAEQSKR